MHVSGYVYAWDMMHMHMLLISYCYTYFYAFEWILLSMVFTNDKLLKTLLVFYFTHH